MGHPLLRDGEHKVTATLNTSEYALNGLRELAQKADVPVSRVAEYVIEKFLNDKDAVKEFLDSEDLLHSLNKETLRDGFECSDKQTMKKIAGLLKEALSQAKAVGQHR
jgi:Golgi nucleoside diphosphatase